MLKRIKIIATGGTISSDGIDRLDLKDYKPGKLKGEDFFDELPEIKKIANVEVEQLTNFGSSNITSVHWLDLKNRIEQALNKEDFDGVVITHGTNTLEETAYFLHLTVSSEKPVVLVGSQRPFYALGSDASINLINAIRVAAEPTAFGKGVLVVLNDEINSARDVTKTNTYRVGTFQSGQLGILGYVDPDQKVEFYRSPSRKHTVHSKFSKLPALHSLPNVVVLYSYAGASEDLINHVVESGNYQGIVMAGMGAGHVSKSQMSGLLKAVDKGMYVVRSSRVGNGRVVMLNNNNWLNCITADNLPPHKARILLMLSLLVSQEQTVIQQMFNEY